MLVMSFAFVLILPRDPEWRQGTRRLPVAHGDHEVTPDAVEFWSTQGIEAALARAAGGDQQILLVAGDRLSAINPIVLKGQDSQRLKRDDPLRGSGSRNTRPTCPHERARSREFEAPSGMISGCGATASSRTPRAD
jgi:hypothetical protein